MKNLSAYKAKNGKGFLVTPLTFPLMLFQITKVELDRRLDNPKATVAEVNPPQSPLCCIQHSAFFLGMSP